MRWLWVWMVTAVWASVTTAAVTGRVTSIGFQSFIRLPEWTPLVVQTNSDELAPHTYNLQVVQTDLDGDEVVYARTGITVNPGTQTFRTYFRPETSNGGLPVSGTDSGNDLAKRLRVFLFDPATGKRAVRVGVAGSLPQALENGQLGDRTGQQLILIVGRSPSTIELTPGNERVVGLAESRYFVQIDPARLPESVLAYGAVDAVIWTDADAGRITPSQLNALREYVRGGGTLGVVQTADIGRTGPFDELLPVKPGVANEWSSREPLASILQPQNEPGPKNQSGGSLDAWKTSQLPYRMNDATVRDASTIVDTWTTWPDGHRSPLIARRLYGLGCVAWIAQDISEPAIAAVSFGWPRVWQRLLDWRDVDLTFPAAETAKTADAARQRYKADTVRDLGGSFIKGMNLEGRTYTLLSLTFVFFAGYWALAGPISFVVLAARRKTSLSWFVFGAIAAVATITTILIAQVVLRGDAQVKHVSLVRGRPGEAGRVLTRLGVYLPKDTIAAIALPQEPGAASAALSPFESDPSEMRDHVTPRDSQYTVAVGSDADAKTVQINVPFRSTLKKLQADWSGPVAGTITGQPRLTDADVPIAGRVSNDTGHDLRDVLIVFRGQSRVRGDFVISMPDWKAGQTFELDKLWASADSTIKPLASGRNGLPPADKPVKGRWSDFVIWLYEDLRGGNLTGNSWDDSGTGYGRSFPVVSLFCRCPPMANLPNDASRVDLLRRGVRQWDVSSAVAAGGMVVLGKAVGPLPLPLTVEGEKPPGDGVTFFQSVLPIDRGAFNNPEAPTTQPID